MLFLIISAVVYWVASVLDERSTGTMNEKTKFLRDENGKLHRGKYYGVAVVLFAAGLAIAFLYPDKTAPIAGAVLLLFIAVLHIRATIRNNAKQKRAQAERQVP